MVGHLEPVVCLFDLGAEVGEGHGVDTAANCEAFNVGKEAIESAGQESPWPWYRAGSVTNRVVGARPSPGEAREASGPERVEEFIVADGPRTAVHWVQEGGRGHSITEPRCWCEHFFSVSSNKWL
jgi:hypothetical protein